MKNSKMNGKARSGKGKFLASGVTASAMLVVAGCAGSAGADESVQGGAGGFEYGAPQEDVNEVVADLDPVTITYQVSAPAENSITGRHSMQFKEEVERRSNGQIEVEIIWGMAVAGYPEAVDAVVDGRVDISYHLVSYEPQRFPEASAIGTALGSVEDSPVVGEMVANAVGTAIGWSNEALLERYESEGVTPLAPILVPGAYSLNCNSKVATAEALQGKQVRSASAAQIEVLKHFGAVPTSLEFTEAFEALQRGTVDCDLSTMSGKEISGIYQAAPHLAYSTTANWPRFSATYLAGPNFDNLPLAYQQILFDSSAFAVSESAKTQVDSKAVHIEDLNSVDSTIDELGDEFQSELGELLTEQQNTAIEEGHLPEDIITQVSDLADTWEGRVADLGYEDGGDISDMNEWYDPDADWSDFAWDVYENTGALEFRPE